MSPSRLKLLYLACCVMQGVCAFGLDHLDPGIARLAVKVLAGVLLATVAAIAGQVRQLLLWLVFVTFVWVLLPRIYS